MACKVDFTGKCLVFITGASKGLGRAVALELAKLAAKNSVFILIARSKTDLEETRSQVMKINNTIDSQIYPLDLSKATETDYEQMFSSVITSNFELNSFNVALFIHNAGSVGDLNVLTALSDLKTWREYFDFNLFSVTILTSLFYNKLKVIPKKVLVNITSLLGRKPFKTMGLYGVGKAARDFYFKVLAEENPELVILSYSPGPVDTDMFHGVISNTNDTEIKKQFNDILEKKQLLSADKTMNKMLGLLQKGDFKSGDVVDYYDLK